MQQVSTDRYPIYIGNDSYIILNAILEQGNFSSMYILVDEHTKKKCLPAIKRNLTNLRKTKIITIRSGEKNKNLNTCTKIWNELSKDNADRKSLLINLGGGVITDIGGFTTSTYKRGIEFLNIPTSLLAQVDASVGGKTGIDFNQFKNQIGTFSFPKTVFIIPEFLKTLPQRELISGFAEVIKHGLIADKSYWNTIKATNPLKTTNWEGIILKSVELKSKIVTADPFEKGLRKVLNFGHTIGHAVESLSLKKDKKPLLHGEAIAIGMICEAYLSRKYCGLGDDSLNEIVTYIRSVFDCKPLKYNFKQLIELMYQDKKNNNFEINFSLLSSIGKAEINHSCSIDLIEESIGFFNMK